MPPIVRGFASVVRPSSVSAFLHVRTVPDENWWEYNSDLWAAYEDYCAGHGIRPDCKKTFAVLLQRQGAIKPKSNNAYRRWYGVKLLPKKTDD